MLKLSRTGQDNRVDKFGQVLYGARKCLIFKDAPCIAFFLSTLCIQACRLSRQTLDNPVHNTAIAVYGIAKSLI